MPGPDQCLFTLSGPGTAPTQPSTLPPFVFNGDMPTSQCKLHHFRANTRLSALIYKWAEHGDLFTLQIDRAEHRQCDPSPVDPGRAYLLSVGQAYITFEWAGSVYITPNRARIPVHVQLVYQYMYSLLSHHCIIHIGCQVPVQSNRDTKLKMALLVEHPHSINQVNGNEFKVLLPLGSVGLI